MMVVGVEDQEYLELMMSVIGECFWNIQATCALKKPFPATPKLHFPFAFKSAAMINSKYDISCVHMKQIQQI